MVVNNNNNNNNNNNQQSSTVNNNNNNNNNNAPTLVAPVSSLTSEPVSTPSTPGAPINQFGPAAPPASPGAPQCPLPQSTLNVRPPSPVAVLAPDCGHGPPVRLHEFKQDWG